MPSARPLAFVLALASAAPVVAQTASLAYAAPYQRLAREVYKELIEINTMDSVGNVTTAAKAMARRFREAGFPAADVQVLAPRQPIREISSCAIRARRPAPKPMLLLAHLDVVAALKPTGRATRSC